MKIPFNYLLQKPEEQLCIPVQIGSKLANYKKINQDKLTDVFVKTKLVLFKVSNISETIYPATIIAALPPRYTPLIIESSSKDHGLGLGRVISIAFKSIVCLMKMTDDYQKYQVEKGQKASVYRCIGDTLLEKIKPFLANCAKLSSH